MSELFPAVVVREAEGAQRGKAAVEKLTREQWLELYCTDGSEDRVEIDVDYSSLNYKDALCTVGHPGVARHLPMVAGIDAAGTLVSDPGRQVLVDHANFGTKHSGGYCSRISVPRDFVLDIPQGLTTRLAVQFGTAGFTAAQSVDRLVAHGIEPGKSVIVTGATGGVGSLAVMLLAARGFVVTAVTGKADRHHWLQDLGASFVLSRDALPNASEKPLGSAKYAAAVDTVGGDILASVLSIIQLGGIATACGHAAGANMTSSMYPFILRGVTLAGIDSGNISLTERKRIWDQIPQYLADLDLETLASITTEISMDALPERAQVMLDAKIVGRTLVNICDE